MVNFVDLTGQRFGRLVALSRAENTPGGQAQWRCRCDCGADVTTRSAYLRRGGKRSCNCLRAETSIRTAKGRLHPASPTLNWPLYRTWRGMIARCEETSHKSYATYGGRGIRVCDRWRDSFSAFLADVGARPTGTTLDRIDGNGNYEPGNCRWASSRTQGRNRRNRRTIELDGKAVSVTEAAEILGVSKWKLFNGLRQKGDPFAYL